MPLAQTRREKELAEEIRFNLSRIQSVETVGFLQTLQFDLQKAFQIGRTNAAPKFLKDCLKRVESLTQAGKCSSQELACVTAAIQGVKTAEDSFFILLKILEQDVPILMQKLGSTSDDAEGHFPKNPAGLPKPRQIPASPQRSIGFLDTPSIEVHEADISPRKSAQLARIEPNISLKSPSQSARHRLSFLDSQNSAMLIDQNQDISRVQFNEAPAGGPRLTREQRLERLRELRQHKTAETQGQASVATSHMTLQELCDSNMLGNTADDFPPCNASIAIQTSFGTASSKPQPIISMPADQPFTLVMSLYVAQDMISKELRARQTLIDALDEQQLPYLKRHYVALLRVLNSKAPLQGIELPTAQHTPLFSQYQKSITQEIDRLKTTRKTVISQERQNLIIVQCLMRYAQGIAQTRTLKDGTLYAVMQEVQRYTNLLQNILRFKTKAARRRQLQERIMILQCRIE